MELGGQLGEQAHGWVDAASRGSGEGRLSSLKLGEGQKAQDRPRPGDLHGGGQEGGALPAAGGASVLRENPSDHSPG